MSEYIVSLQGVCKSYGGVPVLKNADFKVKRGTIHALVGGNGAGKSTMMKILTGVVQRDAGTIVIDDEEVDVKTPGDAEKRGIQMIFQELSLIPTLNVTENIFLNHEIKKGRFLDYKAMDEKAGELIKEIGFEVELHRNISDIEVGTCQLIEIAKALSKEAKVLVMDEPTTALTNEEVKILFGIMRRLKKQGVSIVYISHRLQEVLDISDEITVLRDGQIIESRERSGFEMNTLIDAIIGRANEDNFVFKEREHPVEDEVLLDVKDLTWKGNPNKISFQLRKGEVLGLIGLLGSGRTETLETLFGIKSDATADITLDGKKLQTGNTKNSIEAGFALVPEDRRRQGLVLMHSVKDNLLLPNMNSVKRGAFLPTGAINSFCDDAVSDFNVKTSGIEAGMLSLSGGNQQKVVFAKWLRTHPKVILMDEPTAGVDIGAKGELIALIRRFSEEGTGVILVSSEMSEILAICDRVLVLKDGQITQNLKREEISGEEELHYAIQQ